MALKILGHDPLPHVSGKLFLRWACWERKKVLDASNCCVRAAAAMGDMQFPPEFKTISGLTGEDCLDAPIVFSKHGGQEAPEVSGHPNQI